MKRFFLSIAVVAMIISCGGKDGKKQEGNGSDKDATADISQNPDYQKGVTLVGKNDCLTCHKINETLTGPAYSEVANKYAANTSDTVINYLAEKIISGGKGVWGETFMTPHPGVSKEDAEAMVKYILLLKK